MALNDVIDPNFDAALNRGSKKEQDRVTVSIQCSLSGGGGASVNATVSYPPGTIDKDAKKAELDAYNDTRLILGRLKRRLQMKIKRLARE